MRWLTAIGSILHMAALGVMAAAAASGVMPGPIVDAEVRSEVAGGSSRVIVELRVERRDDPAAIARAQRRVIDALPPGHALLGRRYESVPMLALQIDADALAVLERLGDTVVRVRVDSVKAPQR